MNIFTPLFLIYYIYQLFTQHKSLRLYSQKYDGLKYDDMKDKMLDDMELAKDTLVNLMLSLFYIGIMFIEFIYICNAFAVDKQITLYYFIFWVSVLLFGLIKVKFKKKSTYIKAVNFRLSLFVYNLVDISFFGYMFYMLFIK